MELCLIFTSGRQSYVCPYHRNSFVVALLDQMDLSIVPYCSFFSLPLKTTTTTTTNSFLTLMDPRFHSYWNTKMKWISSIFSAREVNLFHEKKHKLTTILSNWHRIFLHFVKSCPSFLHLSFYLSSQKWWWKVEI